MLQTQNATLRLDWALFALRWLLVVGVISLAIFLPTIDENRAAQQQTWMWLAAALGIVFALTGTGLVLWANDGPLPGLVALAIDTLYAMILFWASGGMPLVLLAAGMLPVIIGTLRLSPIYGLLAAIILAVAGPLLSQLTATPTVPADNGVLVASSILLLLASFIAIPAKMASLGWIGQQNIMREREKEAARLRAARNYARVIYEMSATLSATLKYEAVLNAALDVGRLGLRKMDQEARLTSAVLLFDVNSGHLKVASGRGLTRSDLARQVHGKRGVLGLALRQTEPIFAGDAQYDAELQYFVAFQDTQSILCVPLRAGFDTFGVLVYGSTLPNAFSKEHLELLTAIGNQVTIALQNAILYQDLLDEKDRIIEVEEEARKQLSRDLHDGPTQQVAAIAMHVNYIRRLLEREPSQVMMELEKVEELARQTTKEIRHMLFTLRPYVLETRGLIAALTELASKLKENFSQNVILKVQEGIENFVDTNDQGVIFAIIEEAVGNVRKHAEAEHVWVRLARRDQYLWLEVEDDGVGFDQDEVNASYDTRGSLGMVNLRERAELINGRLRIESAEGKGTKIIVIAPLRESVLQMMTQATVPMPAITPENAPRSPGGTGGTVLRPPATSPKR